MGAAFKAYTLLAMAISYLSAELGRHLIGVTSKATAQDLHYGDISCQLNSTELSVAELPVTCDRANNSQTCESFTIADERYCEWTYNGLGLDYQILAGPSFIAVYTVVGVFWGVMADKYNRVRLLAVCTLVCGVAVVTMGMIDEYWQLLLLRMMLASGEAGLNPLGTGVISDMFSQDVRSLAMSVFNLGIYGGFGLAFPVGRYVTEMDAWGLGWRLCYFGSGVLALVVAVILWLTLREPARQEIGAESATDDQSAPRVSIWKVMLQPVFVVICLAASVRHMGGLCWAYNSNLFYQHYFPDYDLSWYLFAISFGMGSMGVLAGGLISDKLVGSMGVASRVAVLAVSQLVAVPFAFGGIFFDPLWAMISLCLAYFFAEMWFGILFAILVEIVPLSVRSTTVGIFLFVMNNIGGNLPILVEPVRQVLGFREALYIFYIGAYVCSSFLFFSAIFLVWRGAEKKSLPESHETQENPGFIPDKIVRNGHSIESQKM